MKRCRSCDAPIRWAQTVEGGRMPLDADPVADGTVLLAFGNGEPLGLVLTGRTLDFARHAEIPLYRSHFASCPDADEWRRQSRERRETK